VTLDELYVLVVAARGPETPSQTVLTSMQGDSMITVNGSMATLTDRGQAFLEHILALPLPEQVWRMPGERGFSWPAPNPIVEDALRKIGELHTYPAIPLVEPAPSPPARFVVPTDTEAAPMDPAERTALAHRLLNSGQWSRNEVKEKLKLSETEMQAIFPDYAG
jgi:hypothetical protein